MISTHFCLTDVLVIRFSRVENSGNSCYDLFKMLFKLSLMTSMC